MKHTSLTLSAAVMLLASAGAPCALHAQSPTQTIAPAPQGPARITGYITDGRGRRIIGATVTADVRPDGAVRSDSTGHFTMPGLDEGLYYITVRKIGYGPKRAEVAASKNHPFEVQFVMEQTAQELAPVTIETRPWVPQEYRNTHRFDSFFENRHDNMGGVFYTKADIEKNGGFSASMNRIPGIQMRYGQYGRLVVNMDRCRSDKIVYIINDINTPDGLSTIIPEQIETMEVYQGINNVPAKARGDACAAIVIQTR